MMNNVAISITNLSKRYNLRKSEHSDRSTGENGFDALKEVSIEIEEGESVAIVGPNGSGKSTLLRILAGVTKPSSGSAKVKGKVAGILDIGAGFHPELSGHENIFLNGQLLGFSKKEIDSKVEEIIDFSGIGSFVREPVKNYSNGMFLRLAFSVVIHLDFDVYLFDEVLGAGDFEFQQKFQQKLLNLQKSKGKTVIIVSHQIRDFKRAVGRCLYLQNGRLTTFKSVESYFINVNKFGKLAANTKLKSEFAEEVMATVLNLTANGIKWEEEILVQISIEGLKRQAKLGISIKDIYKQTVFESYFDKSLQPSINLMCKVVIPPKFFNSGQYQLDVLFSDMDDQVEIIREVLDFNVTYTYQEWEIAKQSWGNTKPDLKLVWENLKQGNV